MSLKLIKHWEQASMRKQGSYLGGIIYDQIIPEQIIVPAVSLSTYIFIFPNNCILLLSSL